MQNTFALVLFSLNATFKVSARQELRERAHSPEADFLQLPLVNLCVLE